MKSVRIKNMKSFVDSGDIEIKPITLFVGKNSCGKSSLLRFPAVLGQTFLARTDSPLAFFGQFVDYGSFESVKHKGKNDNEEINDISFSVRFDIATNELFDFYITLDINDEEKNKYISYMGEIADVRIEVTLDKPQKQIKMKEFKVFFNDSLVASFLREKDDAVYEYKLYKNFTENGIFELCNSIDLFIESFNYFVPMFDEEDALNDFEEKILNENPDISDNELEKYKKTFENQVEFASGIVREIVDNLYINAQCMSYIGPFREDPKRIYRDTENDIRDVGSKGENLSTILLRESEKDKGMINQISKWLKKNYGYTLEISPSYSGYFNILLVDENGIKSNIMDVGYGISQVLPIITQLIRNIYIKNRTFVENMDEIVLIEQPELHLHPAAQANLAELIAYSVEAKKSQRILIETHSEHLIRKLQVLVAKKTYLSPDMLAVYSVEKNNDGQAIVKKMELNEEGRFLTKWPSGFFDKSHELASELRNANSSEV